MRVCYFISAVILLSTVPACLPFLTPTIPVNQGPTRFAVVQPLQNQISEGNVSSSEPSTEMSNSLSQFEIRTSEGSTSFAPSQILINEGDDERVRNGIYQEYRNDPTYQSWFTLESTIQDSDTMLLIPEITRLERGSKRGSPAGTAHTPETRTATDGGASTPAG